MVPKTDAKMQNSAPTAPQEAHLEIESTAPLAARFGPSPAEIAIPLAPQEIPDAALRCPTFAAARALAA